MHIPLLQSLQTKMHLDGHKTNQCKDTFKRKLSDTSACVKSVHMCSFAGGGSISKEKKGA